MWGDVFPICGDFGWGDAEKTKTLPGLSDRVKLMFARSVPGATTSNGYIFVPGPYAAEGIHGDGTDGYR